MDKIKPKILIIENEGITLPKINPLSQRPLSTNDIHIVRKKQKQSTSKLNIEDKKFSTASIIEEVKEEEVSCILFIF